MKNGYVYIEKLAYDFGLFDLPKNEQKKIINDLNKAFEERLLSKILDQLNDDDKNNFAKIIKSGDQEDVMNFVVENIPNLPKTMDAVYLQMRKELLADAEA